MLIYVVYEEDRGMGTSIVAAYTSRARAEREAGSSSHYYVEECELDQQGDEQE